MERIYEISDKPLVVIVMGSKSDLDTMKETMAISDELRISYEAKVVSAHRTPDQMFEYAELARERGLKVILAGAGGAAHLPGMVAAKGYPDSYVKGTIIKGLDTLEGVDICHMGTKLVDGKYTLNGGRVLFVVGVGEILETARQKVYKEIEKIDCEDLFYRTDIAKKAVSL